MKKSVLIGIVLIVVVGIIIAGVFLIKDKKQSSSVCGIENCHGLEVICGSNVPDGCTEIYQFGDRCRRFVSCEKLDGECQRIEQPQYENCLDCINQCNEDFSDPVEKFSCEGKC